MNEQRANDLFNQSIELIKTGSFSRALKNLTRLNEAIPGNPSILYFLAIANSFLGHKKEAIRLFELATLHNPQFVEAYNNQALDLAYLGELQTALHIVEKAVATRPDFFEAQINKGCLLNDLNRPMEAVKCFKAALTISPNNPNALANLAISYLDLNNVEESVALCNRIIKLFPTDPKPHVILGNLALKQETPENAIAHFTTAKELAPENVDVLSGLGSSYSNAGNDEKALEIFENARRINPTHAKTLMNIGLLHQDSRQFDKAIDFFSRRCDDKRHEHNRLYNLALTYLHAGNLKEGWEHYKERWKERGFANQYLASKRPMWNGKYTESNVLIWYEQGIGDQILFGGLLPDAVLNAPNLFVQLDARLLPLYQRSFPKIRFVPHTHQVTDADFDFHLPFGSLGQLFRPTFETFSSQPTKFLEVDQDRRNALQSTLSRKLPKIGLAWTTKGMRSKERTLPLDMIVSSIQSVLPCEFIDLQYSDTTQDRNNITINQGITIQRLDDVDNLNDLDGLAALISACDFVITCSNSTAHLAGALGKETYLLVPFSRGRHWYWSHIREDGHSIWYPSIRLIPQTTAGDWTKPLKSLSQILGIRKGSKL